MSNKIALSTRDIIAAFSYCIVKQSPYPKVEGIETILEDIRQGLINNGFSDELLHEDKFSTYKELDENTIYKILISIRDNVESFKQLNVSNREKDKKPNERTQYLFCDVYSTVPRDADFIDLDACINNVISMIINNN